MADQTLSHQLVQRLIVLSLIFGFVGGAAGAYGIIRYSPALIPTDKRQVVLQDSSAVIDVIKKVSPTVVSITSESTVRQFSFFGIVTGKQKGAGTGVIVSEDGLIMTNKHVVESDTATYTIITSDGKEYKDAKVVARDPQNDIAFLRVSAKGLPVAELGDSSNLTVGQRVIAIGNALGQFQNSATDGIISGLGRPITAGDEGGASTEALSNLIQTDAAINPGNSGGPLVNILGQVIGINTAVAGDAQNIGFAIPINEAKSALGSVKEKGKISRAYLGVRYIEITKDFASANNLGVNEGAYITGDRQNLAVLPNSPAFKAGLKDGDILTKIAGDKIDATHSVTSLIGKHKPGDKMKLTFLRDNKEQTVEVTLEEAPTGQ
jgi:serine protease Do